MSGDFLRQVLTASGCLRNAAFPLAALSSAQLGYVVAESRGEPMAKRLWLFGAAPLPSPATLAWAHRLGHRQGSPRTRSLQFYPA